MTTSGAAPRTGATSLGAGAGDDDAFAAGLERHRRELHVHCYRMLASFDEAEDAVQEAFLRAWRNRERFEGSELFRAWLYRIATNVCLDLLRRRSRRPAVGASFDDLPWLQPYPDRLLDEVGAALPGFRAAGGDDDPDVVAVARETIELSFLAALQVLPARQRAALIARDVLGWSARETAAVLDASEAATNSALQRARATMQRHLPAARASWRAPASAFSAEERELLARFMEAHERCDEVAALAIAATDIRVTMPPLPFRFDGVAAVRSLMERAFGEAREGDWRLVPTECNRMPAAASYLRRWGDGEFRAFKLDVLRVGGGKVVEITTFDAHLFAAFGLPATLATATTAG